MWLAAYERGQLDQHRKSLSISYSLPPAEFPTPALSLSESLVWISRDLPRGHLWLVPMMQDRFQKMIPDLPQPKQEVTQSYTHLSDFWKAVWVNVITRLDFHFAIEIDVQKASPRLHTTESYWSPHDLNTIHSSPLDLQKKRDNMAKKSSCYSLYGVAVPNLSLSHFTIQILCVWSRSHMVKAEQNMGFLFCSKSPCFNTLFSSQTVMESECLLLNLNSRSFSMRHF